MAPVELAVANRVPGALEIRPGAARDPCRGTRGAVQQEQQGKPRPRALLRHVNQAIASVTTQTERALARRQRRVGRRGPWPQRVVDSERPTFRAAAEIAARPKQAANRKNVGFDESVLAALPVVPR